jgi:hypothetical protein
MESLGGSCCSSPIESTPAGPGRSLKEGQAAVFVGGEEFHRFPLKEEKMKGKHGQAETRYEIKINRMRVGLRSRHGEPADRSGGALVVRTGGAVPGRLSSGAEEMQHFHPLRLIPADLSLLLSVPFEMWPPLRKHLVLVPVPTSASTPPE